MLEKILIFVIFLGPLVFFHELGHYLFARLFGVRVEVFSIGFGPKILKKKWGDTEYAVSIIPLGGYVKMYGDDPFNKDSVPEEERHHSFIHKGKWARFWIVMGGPLANFILAFAIFFSLLMSGERIPEIKLGNITKESVLYTNGLRAGDVLVKIGESPVYNPADLMVDSSTKSMTVKRGEDEVQLNVDFSNANFFDEVMKFPPLFKKPVVIDEKGNRFVVSTKSDSIDINLSLEEIAARNKSQTLYLHSIAKEVELNEELKVEGIAKELNFNYTDTQEILAGLLNSGFRTMDLEVKSVNMNSAADKAGIRAGDIVAKINNQNVLSFEELRNTLQAIESNEVTIGLFKTGEFKEVTLVPDVVKQDGKDVKLMGVYGHIEAIRVNFIQTASKGFSASVTEGVARTWDSMVKTFDGFIKLVTNQVSLKAIGGPLSIGKVAHDSFHTSTTYFFQLTALISVNLGVINLFPIPVLDGGHIMFIGFEIINGGPLSRKKMELAMRFGFALLLALMFGAIFNDITRFF